MYHAIIFTGLHQVDRSYYRPLGAYRIRSELESLGYNVKVLEHFHHLTDEHIEQALDKYVGKETLWVGFSTTFINTSTLLKDRTEFFTQQRQKHNVPFVVGGAKSIVEFLPFADAFITGYADNAAVAITDYYAGKGPEPQWSNYKGAKLINSNHQYDRKDLSNIGVIWKPEDHINPMQSLPMEIARGCIFNCAFCNFPLNNKKKFDYVRVKDDMYAEFMRNYEDFGVTNYWFMDDTYNDSMHKLELMHDVITSLPFKINYDTYIKPELVSRWPDQVALLAETGLRGASLGVESLNREARQAVQKGADADKVLDVISALKSANNRQIKIQCNFIVGLPHESIESIWQTHETVINNDDIDWWNWYPLQIHSKDHYEYHSPIDRDPKKYGYEVADTVKLIKSNFVGDNIWMGFWKNDKMNSMQAKNLSTKLRAMDEPLQKVAGWNCGSYASLGLDIDKHYEEHDGLIQKMPIEDMKKAKDILVEDYIQSEIM